MHCKSFLSFLSTIYMVISNNTCRMGHWFNLQVDCVVIGACSIGYRTSENDVILYTFTKYSCIRTFIISSSPSSAVPRRSGFAISRDHQSNDQIGALVSIMPCKQINQVFTSWPPFPPSNLPVATKFSSFFLLMTCPSNVLSGSNDNSFHTKATFIYFYSSCSIFLTERRSLQALAKMID